MIACFLIIMRSGSSLGGRRLRVAFIYSFVFWVLIYLHDVKQLVAAVLLLYWFDNCGHRSLKIKLEPPPI